MSEETKCDCPVCRAERGEKVEEGERKGIAYCVDVHAIPEVVDRLKEAKTMLELGYMLAMFELKNKEYDRLEKTLTMIGEATKKVLGSCIKQMVPEEREIELCEDGQVRDVKTGAVVENGGKINISEPPVPDAPEPKFTGRQAGTC